MHGGAASYPPSGSPLLQWVLHNAHGRTSVANGASRFHSVLHTAISVGAPAYFWGLLNPLLDLGYERIYLIPDSVTLAPVSAM